MASVVFGACWIMKFSVSVMVSVLRNSYRVFKDVMPVGLSRIRVSVVSLMIFGLNGTRHSLVCGNL